MTIRIFLLPYDSGYEDARMGAGPRILEPTLTAALRADGHTVEVETITADVAFRSEIAMAFGLSRKLSKRMSAARERGELPFVLSGNCNSSLGALSGLGCDRTAVIWLDGHGEFNTPETTRSGFLDGMPLAVATGHCWQNMASGIPGFAPIPGNHVLLAGVRETEPEEQALLEASGVLLFPPQRLHESEIDAELDALRERADQAYIHLDLDALDPIEGRSNQWVEPGGLSVADVESLLSKVLTRFPIAGAAVASYDPIQDPDRRIVGIAVELLRGLVPV